MSAIDVSPVRVDRVEDHRLEPEHYIACRQSADAVTERAD